MKHPRIHEGDPNGDSLNTGACRVSTGHLLSPGEASSGGAGFCSMKLSAKVVRWKFPNNYTFVKTK